MSPIPKFAQVLAKRAKAKPKVISGSPVTKKITNTQTKKFAKDDMELAKIRKEKIRKELEPFLKKSKDDFEFIKSQKSELKELVEFLPKNFVGNLETIISYMEKIQKIDIMSIKNEDLESIKERFNSIKLMLKDLGESEFIIENIDALIGVIYKIKSGKLSSDTANKLKSTFAEINNLNKKIKE